MSSTEFKINNIKFIEILIPEVGAVVISWTAVPNLKNVVAYGFAAGATRKDAFTKSQVELYRNIHVLERYINNPLPIPISELSIQEQRLLWFSNEMGHKKFLDKVRESLSLLDRNHVPVLILDKEIIGPWSQYTNVWRCLFKPSISHHEYDQDVDFFFF